MKLNFDKDHLLSDFAKETLSSRYLYDGETFQEMFARNAKAYSDNSEDDIVGYIGKDFIIIKVSYGLFLPHQS